MRKRKSEEMGRSGRKWEKRRERKRHERPPRAGVNRKKVKK